MASAPQPQEQRQQPEASNTCPTCLNLDHRHFLDNRTNEDYAHASSTSQLSTGNPRFRLFEFDALVDTANRGCLSCGFMRRAIDHYWADEGSFYSSRLPDKGRNFRRMLCLAHQPRSSLLLFRVREFDDTPDTSIIQTLAIRDSTARIEFYRVKPASAPDVPAAYPAIGCASHVPERIALERAVDLAREWMSSESSTLWRAFDWSTRSLMEAVEVEPYLTLSHCWGSRKSAELLLKTRQHNIRQHHQQIPWADIPPLFRDAISLVRALGYRYIWIDSLCIIQDDDEDWMTESAAMAEIYSNAVLNIAGTAMRNSMSSLFRPRIHGQGFRDLKASNGDKSAASLQDMVLEGGALGGDTLFARISHDRSHEVLYGDMGFFRTSMEPMLNRAWVFQERLLSRRTLHFSASEVLWECRTCCLCECTGMDWGHDLSVRSLNAQGQTLTAPGGYSLPTPSPSRLFQPKKVLFSNICHISSGDRPRGLLDFWLRLVDEYSFLMLSHQTD
ncbi:Heterokaryon incompatibility protein (HET) domain containing protein [Rhypophila sp. PSN 637]